MQKVSLQQAVKMTSRSESTLRRDVKKGKVSAERDERRHLRFDIAELQRVYGELKTTGEDAQSTGQGVSKAMTGHDREEIVTLYWETRFKTSRHNWRKLTHNSKSQRPRKRNSWIFCLRRKTKSEHSCHQTKKKRRNLQTGCSGLLVRDSSIQSQKRLAYFSPL